MLCENVSALDDLIKQIRSPRGIIPFVGAGMSVDFEYPSWTKFLLSQAEKIRKKSAINALLEAGNYEEAAQRLEDAMNARAFQDAYREAFRDRNLESQTVDAAVSLLPQLTKGPVVTTNFDRVLETIFRRVGVEFRVVRGARIDAFSDAIDLSLHYLLKLHGDFDDRTDRVLTLREYESRYGSQAADRPASQALLPKQLELLAVKGNFLFLGCSLKQDRTMEVLRNANERFKNIVHYAVLEEPATPKRRAERIAFLSERGIRPIWYPKGKHGAIKPLLAYLVEQTTGQMTVRGADARSEIADRVEALIESQAQLVVGRDVELRRLDEYLVSGSEPMLVVTGNAGTGKTALLAHWVRSHRRQEARIACHFFSAKLRLTSLSDCYRNLLDQLPDSADRKNDSGARQNGGELRAALYHRLKQVPQSDQRPLVVVIDALDESERPFGPPFPSPLPMGIRVIVSARAGAGPVPEYLKGWIENGKPLNLEWLSHTAIESWVRRAGGGILAARNSGADLAALTDRLDQLTEGFPLFLSYVLAEMVREAESGRDPATVLQNRPKGFSEYVREQLQQLAVEDALRNQRGWQQILATLAVVNGAISGHDLTALHALSVFDLLALPWNLTRWFDMRRLPDGEIHYALAHPLLAKEFRQALGRLAQEASRDLIAYCSKWSENQSRYAFEHYSDHLVEAERWPDLFDLARDEAFVEQQRGAFPDDPGLPLRTSQRAIEAAIQLDDAAAMGEFTVRRAKLAAGIRAIETPLEALLNGSLERALQLADLHDYELCVLWHLLLVWELQETDRRADAIRVLEKLGGKKTQAVSNWSGACIVHLLLPIAELSKDIFANLGTRLLYEERGTELQVLTALRKLTQRLVARGNYSAALTTCKWYVSDLDSFYLLIVRHLASLRGFDAARDALKKNIQKPAPAAQAVAYLAAELAETGRRDEAETEIARALELARGSGKAQAIAEVAAQQARMGLLDQALETLETVSAPILVIETLARIAADQRRQSDDSSRTLAMASKYAREGLEPKFQFSGMCQEAIVYANAGREEDARRIFEELFLEAQPTEENAGERLYALARAASQGSLFDLAMRAIGQMAPNHSGWKQVAVNHIAPRLAEAGRFTEAMDLAIADPGRWGLPIVEGILGAHVGENEGGRFRRLIASLLKTQTESPASNQAREEALVKISKVVLKQVEAPAPRRNANAIRQVNDLVARAESGQLAEALEEARWLESAVAAKAIGRILEVAIRSNRADEVKVLKLKLPPSKTWTLVRARMALAYARNNQPDLAMKLFQSALGTVGRIQERAEQQKALIEIAVAQRCAGLTEECEATLNQAVRLQYAPRDVDELVSPMEEDYIRKLVVEGLSEEGKYAEALDQARHISDPFDRGRALYGMNPHPAPDGFSGEALRVAEEIQIRRHAWVAEMAGVIARVGDKENFKKLLLPASADLESAYEICGILAELYPDQAANLESAVRQIFV